MAKPYYIYDCSVCYIYMVSGFITFVVKSSHIYGFFAFMGDTRCASSITTAVVLRLTSSQSSIIP